MGTIEGHHPTYAADSDHGGVGESGTIGTIGTIERERRERARAHQREQTRTAAGRRVESVDGSWRAMARTPVNHDCIRLTGAGAQWLAPPLTMTARACPLRERVLGMRERVPARACPPLTYQWVPWVWRSYVGVLGGCAVEHFPQSYTSIHLSRALPLESAICLVRRCPWHLEPL